MLYEVIDEMERKDKTAAEKFGEGFEKSKLGCKLHSAFMHEIGEEMCQAEVAHYANKLPEYLCSRPEKPVHFYKKALAVNVAKAKAKARPQGPCEDDVDEDCFADREGSLGGARASAPGARKKGKARL